MFTGWLAAVLSLAACGTDKAAPSPPVEPGEQGDDSASSEDSAPIEDSDARVDEDGDGWYPCKTDDPRGCDCDDADASLHPGADERCDGVDEDCNGEIDDDPVDGEQWHEDQDGDGYGADELMTGCALPPGVVSSGGDCDDLDATVNPGVEEVCNDKDDDCDGIALDGSPCALVDDCPLDVMVVLEYSDGTVDDLTAEFEAATDGDPVLLSLDEAGVVLKLCHGAWYAALTVSAPDVQIVGLEGAEVTTLECDRTLPGVAVSAAGDGLLIDGLGFEGGTFGVDLDDSPSLTIRGAIFRDQDIGIFGHTGPLVIEGSEFYDNFAAISLRGTGPMSVEDCVFQENWGGLSYAGDGSLSVDSSLFESNGSLGSAGGYSVGAGSVQVFVTNTSFLNNNAGSSYYSCGAAVAGGAAIEISDCTFESNFSSGEDSAKGGAICTSGDLNLIDSQFTDNWAAAGWGGGKGGTIYAAGGAVSLERVSISNGYADTAGGAVYLQGGSLSIVDSEIHRNDAKDWGGGVYLQGGTLLSEASSWAYNRPEDLYIKGKGSVTIGSDDYAGP